MDGTAATVAVGAGVQQQQQSSPTNRGNSVAAVSPTRRQELPASDAGQSSSSLLTKDMCGSRCAGTSDSSTVNTADMSCADTDTGFGPANAAPDHNTASASRCVSSDTALTTTSQEASATVDNIDSRASTPTPTPSLHSSGGGIGGDDRDHGDSPSISSSASSPSSSRSGSHHSTASETPSEAASDAASDAAIDATSHLQFDTAMIEQIAARAAAAAAAAVFGVVQQEEDTDALAEEVASLGSSGSGSFGGAAGDEVSYFLFWYACMHGVGLGSRQGSHFIIISI